MVRQNRPADNIGSVAMEHPDPRKMGAVWFRTLFVQNLRYSSEATSALHCGVGQGKSWDMPIYCSVAETHHRVVSRLQLKVVVRENTAVVVYPVHSKLCSWNGTCKHQIYAHRHHAIQQTHRHTFQTCWDYRMLAATAKQLYRWPFLHLCAIISATAQV